MRAVMTRTAALSLLCFGLLPLALYYGLSVHSSNKENASMKESWTIEEVAPTDKDGLLVWAHSICHGLDIDAAAEAMNVEPTRDAVVDALTKSLPSDLRGEVVDVCLKALAAGSKPAK